MGSKHSPPSLTSFAHLLHFPPPHTFTPLTPFSLLHSTHSLAHSNAGACNRYFCNADSLRRFVSARICFAPTLYLQLKNARAHTHTTHNTHNTHTNISSQRAASDRHFQWVDAWAAQPGQHAVAGSLRGRKAQRATIRKANPPTGEATSPPSRHAPGKHKTALCNLIHSGVKAE